MSSIDILPELRAHVARKYGRQTHAAKAWGVSCAFVSGVLTGKKAPTLAILNDAGIERVITYRRAEATDSRCRAQGGIQDQTEASDGR